MLFSKIELDVLALASVIAASIGSGFSPTPEYGGFYNCSSNSNETIKVGIIGGGIAGLYAAILFDTLGIDYEILEASERIGGRVWTYRFDEEAWAASKPREPEYYDYYDVGAMRFPGTEWMARVIGTVNNSLIPYINSKLKPGERPVRWIPYIFQANNTFRLFNNKLVYVQDDPSAQTFDVLVSQGGSIENDTFAAMSPEDVYADALHDLVQALEINFDAGFNLLMQYDKISVREYLLRKGYSSQQIDWMETVNDATSHYDSFSLSQGVIEEWIFTSAPLDSWICVDGGQDRITHGMAQIISKPVETLKRVTAIKPADDKGALTVMDLTELNLDYRKTLAIRKLHYDPAGKIGMKFKGRWWEHLDTGSFQGGQSFSDLPIRRCVYPSYGIHTPNAAGAMIASYTWAQDSNRLGAYYSQQDTRENMIQVTLRNLAAMHNVTYEFLRSQYLESHLWNWYGGEDSVGAFAMFGPDEFSTVLPALMKPGAKGRLHFAGDALSSGHGWIIGAVNSAYRTVAEVLAVEAMDQKLVEMVEMWRVIDEVDMGWYSNAFTDPLLSKSDQGVP